MSFNLIQQKILRILRNYNAPLTIYEIAKEIGVSHQTAAKYLEKLEEEKIIEKIVIEGKDDKFKAEET